MLILSIIHLLFGYCETKSMKPLVPFQAGSPMMVAGPTATGKTRWVNRLLTEDMFTESVSSVLYCYGIYQDYFNQMTIPNVEFYAGLPNSDKVRQLFNGKFHVIVLDDLMEEIVKSLEAQNLFTKQCHHYNITAIFITQNLFIQGPCARNISVNTHVLVLFANKRDEQQLYILGRQLFPGSVKMFIEAYEDATFAQYGYLVVDCSPQSSRELKLRTNIFPGEETVCYIKK